MLKQPPQTLRKQAGATPFPTIRDSIGVSNSEEAKSNSCAEHELWLRPRVSGLVLGETKSWPSMGST
jgi:hypothetical protein